MSDLPPGPYMADDRFGTVRDNEMIIIMDIYGRGDYPGSRKNLADLLIRAEREHDPTPLDAEWLVSVGGEKEYAGDDLREIVEIPADGLANVDWVRVTFPKEFDRTPILGMYGVLGYTRSAPVPTRGTFRTAMRLLGITIEEPKQ